MSIYLYFKLVDNESLFGEVLQTTSDNPVPRCVLREN